jgi:signal transduction histidine kinase
MKSSLRIVYSLIVFVLGIVLLSVLTVLLIYENRQATLSIHQVDHTNIVRHSIESIFSAMKDRESAQRKFLLVGDSALLESYWNLADLNPEFSRLDSLVQSPIQKENLRQLKMLDKARRAKLEKMIRKSADPGYTGSAAYHADLDADQSIMSQIRQLVGQMQVLEKTNLVRQQEDAKRHAVLPTIIGIGISIFSILIFILAFYFTNAELKKSQHLNEELERKNVQLEKYTKELSSFTHITSHDMQEPLRKIELFISMIEEREKESLSPKASQLFEKIKESVSRMRHLFFSIVTFSLADEVTNVKENVNLTEVLGQTLESLKVYIKDTNAVITNGPLPVVYGVKRQLVQVFQNLISNSLKYKRPDVIPEIVISHTLVEGRNTSSPDLNRDCRYYKIDFRDNGAGFDEKYVEKVFEIFQRHLRTERNGFGIGLSICRKIALNHGGTITAESRVNKGSVFSLYLPTDKA